MMPPPYQITLLILSFMVFIISGLHVAHVKKIGYHAYRHEIIIADKLTSQEATDIATYRIWISVFAMAASGVWMVVWGAIIILNIS
jgi:asparagine N-glycosylation enzyme membrane subunit Stt3